MCNYRCSDSIKIGTKITKIIEGTFVDASTRLMAETNVSNKMALV